MPYINTKTNLQISNDKKSALIKGFGKAVSCLGKSESWLMLGFEDNCSMAFRGNESDTVAFVDVSLYGKASASAYNKMTAEVTELISKELGIDADHIYVAYREVENWGWNGGNF